MQKSFHFPDKHECLALGVAILIGAGIGTAASCTISPEQAPAKEAVKIPKDKNMAENPKSTWDEIYDLIYASTQNKFASMTIMQTIMKVSFEEEVPPALLAALIKEESDFQIDAIGPHGAYGLMQVMPDVASQLGLDAKNMEDNIRFGAIHLKISMDVRKGQESNDTVERAVETYFTGNASPAGAGEKQNGDSGMQEATQRVMQYYIQLNGPYNQEPSEKEKPSQESKG